MSGCPALAFLALVVLAPSGWAQARDREPASVGKIYSCITADGRRLSSDRPIAECQEREQRLHRADGSVQRIVPPTPSLEEKSQLDARRLRQELDNAAQADAVRRDRNLLSRYPNEAAHQKARTSGMDDIQKSYAKSGLRVAELTKEYKRLASEAEFYKGKEMPATLKQQLSANEAAQEALRLLQDNQRTEIQRLTKFYDDELARLRRLWAGERPGSTK
ncbi:hypothetical protein ACG0Z6_07030 [Roseateles sp. BYS180W]|uniref:DUF4124 domain-containing protein n=1 Tax=Roseateles rivi TaxID=3299028 RepID=A0ABW7FUL0_9BURK